MTILDKYENWHYKNTTFLILSLFLLYFFFDSSFVTTSVSKIGNLGYVGAFIAGMFFVSVFTVAPAAVVLFHIAEKLNIYEVAILAGIGAVVGDLIIFKFLKDRVFEEIKPLFNKVAGDKLSNLFKTPYFGWTALILGAVIVASPLPDEAGLTLMGVSQIKLWQFIILSLILNVVGIFVIVSFSKL